MVNKVNRIYLFIKYTNQQVEEIIKLHSQGLNPKEIAVIFKTYNTTIRRILIREKIELKNQSQIKSVVKVNPFADLDNEEVQYWLGYIASDGNVGDKRNRINISTNLDPLHLEKYVNFLKYPIKILKYFNKKYEVYEYSVSFSNQEIKDYLVSLGLTPNKSKTLKINFPITWAFLRGIFDGDGCVRKIQRGHISIDFMTASLDFINQIQDFLNCYDIYSTIKKYRSLYYITISKDKYVNLIYDLMYKDSSISLDRKREKFGCLLRKLNNDNSPNSVNTNESTILNI